METQKSVYACHRDHAYARCKHTNTHTHTHTRVPWARNTHTNAGHRSTRIHTARQSQQKAPPALSTPRATAASINCRWHVPAPPRTGGAVRRRGSAEGGKSDARTARRPRSMRDSDRGRHRRLRAVMSSMPVWQSRAGRGPACGGRQPALEPLGRGLSKTVQCAPRRPEVGAGTRGRTQLAGRRVGPGGGRRRLGAARAPAPPVHRQLRAFPSRSRSPSETTRQNGV